jgi:molybdopterin-dependent oxidoreductase alpha subunit
LSKVSSGGGWSAIAYTLKLAHRVGWLRLWRAMRSNNACKTCALGMGGQLGGMVNEGGHFPEVCKKSFQAMASDMQGAIRPDFFERYSIAHLRTLSPRQLESAGRLVTPLLAAAGDTHYRPMTWKEAESRLAGTLAAARPDRFFFYASGRSSNEAGFLLQLLARQLGTNYVHNCSYYCHQASGVALGSSLGTGTSTVDLADLEQADLYVLLGGNPASNHPRLLRTLMQIRRRGGQVVVINPCVEIGLLRFRVPSDVRSLLFGSQIASLYLQPHAGGDIPLLIGTAKAILAAGGERRPFIHSHCEGFEEFRSHVEETSWHEIERVSGVAQAEIEAVARLCQAAKNAVFGWTMGITHHLHGVDNVRMIANLALLLGMVGRPGAGLMPIRGHSNVQGIGSVGVSPRLKQTMLERFERELGIKVPQSPGLDTMACMNACAEGQMDAALCLGGNLFGSNPNSDWACRALSNVGFAAYLSTTLNTGHAWGTAKETVILPVLPRDEEPQATTQESMFNFVRLSSGGPRRHDGPKSEVSILAALGRQLLNDGGPVDWLQLESHQAIRSLMARLVPGYEAVSSLDSGAREFHVANRILHEPRFQTPSGRAQFHAVGIPAISTPQGNRLRLMTVRSEGQFNTVVYEEEDLYRGQMRRDVILIHPDDLARMGIAPGSPVNVEGPAGRLENQLAQPFEVRPGNAVMYYPEANRLIPTNVDPESRTPAFKSVLVTVTPAQQARSTP